MSSSCSTAYRRTGLLLALAGFALGARDVSIAPSVARLFVGQEKVVEGLVTAAAREGNTVRLRLGRPPGDLTVSLVLGLLSKFPPDPEHYYTGQTVRVAGTIASFRGTPEMTIREPADIAVVGDGVPAAPAASAADTQRMRRRIDSLEGQVRRLEEQLRQLRRDAGGAPP